MQTNPLIRKDRSAAGKPVELVPAPANKEPSLSQKLDERLYKGACDRTPDEARSIAIKWTDRLMRGRPASKPHIYLAISAAVLEAWGGNPGNSIKEYLRKLDEGTMT